MRRTLLLVMVAHLSFAMVATGARAQSVEDLAREGAELFQQGRFGEAAVVLLQAYETENVPVLLYNIARAYQQDGRCYMACEYFTRYLDSGDEQALSQAQEHEPGETRCASEYSELMSSADDALNGGQLDRAERLITQALELSSEPAARIMYEQTLFHLGNCEASRDFIESVQAESDFSASQIGELETDLARANECVEGRRCSEMRTGCEDNNRDLTAEAEGAFNSRRKLAYIVGGSGAALLLVAIIHDAASQGTIDDFEQAALQGNVSEFNSLRSDIDSAKTLSWILYGFGGAALITGAVLFFTAPPPGDIEGVQDCNDLCWDWGIGTPSGATGVWAGARF